mmetsp:Transcript_95392/g.242416  ORF Transcript_95392/g.242416 Transcript_95392/m.242416 type:complete len:255 (-) Transcript_95392:1058-1822(-)
MSLRISSSLSFASGCGGAPGSGPPNLWSGLCLRGCPLASSGSSPARKSDCMACALGFMSAPPPPAAVLMAESAIESRISAWTDMLIEARSLAAASSCDFFCSASFFRLSSSFFLSNSSCSFRCSSSCFAFSSSLWRLLSASASSLAFFLASSSSFLLRSSSASFMFLVSSASFSSDARSAASFSFSRARLSMRSSRYRFQSRSEDSLLPNSRSRSANLRMSRSVGSGGSSNSLRSRLRLVMRLSSPLSSSRIRL